MQQATHIFTGSGSIKAFEAFIREAPNKYSSIFILTDTNTRKHCLPVLSNTLWFPESAVILEVAPGEKSKSFFSCTRLWSEMAMHGADRQSLLICLGGGVVCDLGGFVASTFQRGINFVYLPTSLLAQVDAAIGGKTGVNLGNLKNYVGTFSEPRAIFIFTKFLLSLHFEELLSGFAEVIKHALLSSEKIFYKLAGRFPDIQSVRECRNWDAVVSQSANIKSKVVKADFHEKGLRKILNFGHTVGHAFESHSLENGSHPLPHGYAVAMGLIVEMILSVRRAGLDEQFYNKISDYLLSLFPFYFFEPDEIPEIIRLMGFDKKNQSGEIKMVLMQSPGDFLTNVTCLKQEIEFCLNQYLEMGERHTP